jgi:hypothetical protein
MTGRDPSSGRASTGVGPDNAQPLLLGTMRGVAQPGSARPLGGRGPRFESGRPDWWCFAKSSKHGRRPRKHGGSASAVSPVRPGVRTPLDACDEQQRRHPSRQHYDSCHQLAAAAPSHRRSSSYWRTWRRHGPAGRAAEAELPAEREWSVGRWGLSECIV